MLGSHSAVGYINPLFLEYLMKFICGGLGSVLGGVAFTAEQSEF